MTHLVQAPRPALNQCRSWPVAERSPEHEHGMVGAQLAGGPWARSEQGSRQGHPATSQRRARPVVLCSALGRRAGCPRGRPPLDRFTQDRLVRSANVPVDIDGQNSAGTTMTMKANAVRPSQGRPFQTCKPPPPRAAPGMTNGSEVGSWYQHQSDGSRVEDDARQSYLEGSPHAPLYGAWTSAPRGDGCPSWVDGS